MKRLLSAAILIIAFSGCLEEITIEDRIACLELTSYSFTTVPNCLSQDACFEKTHEAFPFNDEVFSSKVREELFGARNSLARTWLFLNRAKENLGTIHDECYSSKTLSKVPKEVNELNANLLTAGEEIDSFSAHASKAIALEIYRLDLEDVNLISEEFLYDDYIILNGNALDFSQKNLYNNTFASRFLSETREFEEIASALEAEGTLAQSSVFSLLSDNDKAILSEAKKSDFEIPFIAPLFSGISSFLSDLFFLGGSVASLSGVPSFGFFSAINSIAGSENSAASEFFKIFSDESSHILSLDSDSSRGMESARASLEKAKERLDSIVAQHGESLPNGGFYLGESAIGPMPFSVSAQGSFRGYFDEKISSLEARLFAVEESSFLNTVSLGGKAGSVKAINSEASSLLEGLDYLESLFSVSVENCSAEVSAIRERLSSGELDGTETAVVSQRARLLAKISSFESNPDSMACSSVLSAYETLLDYLSAEDPDSLAAASAETCISETRSLLENFYFPAEEEKLSSLELLESPYGNPELVLDSCLSLKSAITEKIRSETGAALAREYYAELAKKADVIESILLNYSVAGHSEAQSILGSFAELSQNFSGGELLESSFSEKDAILSALREENANADSFLEKTAKGLFASNYSLGHYYSDSNHLLARVSFLNLADGIDFGFVVSVPLDSRDAEIVFCGENISSVSDEETTVLSFSGLLHGLNSVIFDLNANSPFEEVKQKASPAPVSPDSGGNSGTNAPEDAVEDSASVSEENPDEALAFAAQETLSKALSIKESLAEKISLLEENFSALSEEELESLGPFLPLTSAELSELKRAAESLSLPSEEFSALMGSGDYAAAAELARKNDFSGSLASLSSMEREAERAIEKLKENSLASYNAAVSKRNSSSSSEESDALLAKSRLALEEGSYMESLSDSQSASSAMAVLSSGAGFEVPLAVYPLALVIAGVVVYARRKAGEERKPKKKTRVRSILD